LSYRDDVNANFIEANRFLFCQITYQ